MNYRFYNARILTMETDRLITGELWVQDGKILYVGDGSDTVSVPPARVQRMVRADGTGRSTAGAIC